MSTEHVQHDATGIILSESYALRLRWTENEVFFGVEWALAPSHPLFDTPAANERTCWREGRLVIVNFQKLVWKSLDIDPAIDATGSADLGQFFDIVRSQSGVSVSGDWGELEAQGSVELLFSIRKPARA